LGHAVGVSFSSLGVVSWMVLASTAVAQPPNDDERARMHFQSGQAYFETGEYESALREFTRAHELSGRPALLYNIVLVHERLGNLELAIEFLRRYLNEAPEAEQHRPTLEARVASLERRLEQRAHPRVPVEPASSGPSISPVTWISLGVGGAGLAVFGVFGILALTTAAELDDNCVPLGTCTADDVDSLGTYSLVADIGLLTGVAGGGLGLALLILDLSAGDESSESASRFFGGVF
jgi:tetratricopeptide (TPR) repeat protein